MFIELSSGARLHYQQHGHGPTLVFIHGNGEDLSIFGPLIDRLKKNYTCIAFDTRYHGQSSGPAPTSYEELAQDYDQAFKQLSLTNITLIGFSDGAIIGCLLAQHNPKYLERLIAVGLNLSPESLTNAWKRQLREEVAENPKDSLIRLMNTGPQLTDNLLSQIQLPVLLIASDDDVMESEQYERLTTVIPYSQLVIIPDETHDSYVIGRTDLADPIRTFISNNPTKKA